MISWNFLVALLVALSAPPPEESAEVRDDLGRFFDRFHVKGCFVLYDVMHARTTHYNPERAATRFVPASTFKIFNSLVALETGVIASDTAVIPWDGVDRNNPAWNQDQDMRTAFQRSTVWFYQDLARRIGDRRMKFFLDRERYGNADMSGGTDRFWLTGGLRISADEQIALLRRLRAGKLGFSSRSVAIVERIMTMEETPDHTIRGKTGWGETEVGHAIGWLVGWVERQGNTYFYAMNLESEDPHIAMVEARREVTWGILRALDVLPEKEYRNEHEHRH